MSLLERDVAQEIDTAGSQMDIMYKTTLFIPNRAQILIGEDSVSDFNKIDFEQAFEGIASYITESGAKLETPCVIFLHRPKRGIEGKEIPSTIDVFVDAANNSRELLVTSVRPVLPLRAVVDFDLTALKKAATEGGI